MQHPPGRIPVRRQRQRRPVVAVHPVEGQPGVLLAGRHLHPQQPLDLPPRLLPQRGGQRAGRRPLGRGQQQGGGQAAVDHVLAVVAGVVPAAGDVQRPVQPPAGVEPGRVRPGPAAHGGIAAVGRHARVPGRPAVPGRGRLADRHAGPLQVEEPQRVRGQPGVEVGGDPERVAGGAVRGQPEPLVRAGQGGEVGGVHGQPGARVGARPRLGQSGVDDLAALGADARRAAARARR